MSLQITYEPESGYIEARYEGDLTYGAALAMLSAIDNFVASNPLVHRLYDLNSATLDWNVEDIHAILKLIDAKSIEDASETKVAFVHSDETESAIIRLFITLANKRFSRTIKYFSNNKAALDWFTQSNKKQK